MFWLLLLCVVVLGFGFAGLCVVWLVTFCLVLGEFVYFGIVCSEFLQVDSVLRFWFVLLVFNYCFVLVFVGLYGC